MKTNRANGYRHPLRLSACVSLVVAAGVFTGAFIGGCSTEQRSLVAVRNSGDWGYEHQDYDRALKDFKEYTERAPGDSYGHMMLGKTFLATQKPAEAREQLEIAYANDSQNDLVVETLADTLYHDKSLDDLFRLLRSRVRDRGEAADYILLARYSQLTGDVDEARSSLETAAQLDKGRHVEPQLALARFYKSVNDDQQAVQRLRMAYFIDPTSERVQAAIEEFGQKAKPGWGIKPPEKQ